MNKKFFIITATLAVIAAVVYFLVLPMTSGKSQEGKANDTKLIVDSSSTWNPYAEKFSNTHTLSDFVLTADRGNYIIKMTLTLDFMNEESKLKFGGAETISDKPMSGSTPDNPILTPMEYAINDEVGTLMMNATEKELFDKEELKKYLLNGLNKKLGFEKDLLKDIYIENYVIQ